MKEPKTITVQRLLPFGDQRRLYAEIDLETLKRELAKHGLRIEPMPSTKAKEGT
jgi:hypothetical protein